MQAVLSVIRRAAVPLKRLLWGIEPGEDTFFLVRWLFLRALGIIYLIAFASTAAQVLGLIGSHGILPAADYLKTARLVYPGADYWFNVPTLAWLNSSDAFLQGMCLAGVGLSILLILDFAPAPILAALWLLYLSLMTVGQDFFFFQWDTLLLETGFLALFLAPLRLRPRLGGEGPPSRIVIWLFRWLIFRLMFGSGASKLLSGDPTWRNLSALDYHYWTQPLPTPLAWTMAQLPPWFHQASVVFTFVVELGAPLLFFAPRRLRIIGGLATIGLQILILLTGNYTFFNWLAIALCLPLFDDAFLRHFVPKRLSARIVDEAKHVKTIIVQRVISAALAAWILLITVFEMALVALSVLGLLVPTIAPATRDISRDLNPRFPPLIAQADHLTSRLGMVNSYGLFAVMTTSRPEIIIEGSNDGQTWLPYEFPYKAGDVQRPPPWIAPYQPRLDWQLWFAALGSYQNNPWFSKLMVRLLQGSPDVQALLAKNPFPDAPPQYIRAEIYDYRFTSAATRSATGDWWQAVQIGIYYPVLSASDIQG